MRVTDHCQKTDNRFVFALVLLLASLWAMIGILLWPGTSEAQAPAFEIQWNPNSEPDLAKYTVYWGKASDALVESKDIPLADYVPPPAWMTIQTPLLPGDYYFAATATDLSGNESLQSEQDKQPVPDYAPSPCQGVKARIPVP